MPKGDGAPTANFFGQLGNENGDQATGPKPSKGPQKGRSAFLIRKVKYRSGTTAYRVSGTFDGKRIRRFYPTREEAKSARDQLMLELAAEDDGEKVVTTSLSASEIREAQVAFRMLENAGRKKPLAFYVQVAMERFSESDYDLNLGQAYDRYLNQKSWEQEKGAISMVHYNTLQRDVGGFVKALGRRVPLNTITSDLVTAWIHGLNNGLVTWNNKRGYLDAFFNFCRTEEWIDKNPVGRVRKFKLPGARSVATTLSPEEATKLMTFAETYEGTRASRGRPGFMVPHFALCLFAGIRADVRDGEIGRFASELVNFGTDVIHITPHVSKTNEFRRIALSRNLRNWLERYPLEEFTHLPTRIDWHKRLIRKELGLAKNVLRHSFISYLVARDRSVGDAALQAGNTEDIVRRHYLGLRTREEAEQFWGINPS